jgi:hypothetical protein
MLQATHLQIVLWIPVRVKDDDSVCSSKVDSNPARLGTYEERKTVAPSLAEPINSALPTSHSASINDQGVREAFLLSE